MNIEETTNLCKVIRRLCPAQKWDADTPAAWAVVMKDIPVADALLAVERLGADHPFIGPPDIVTEVKRIRRDRLARIDDTTIAPNVSPDDPRAMCEEVAAIRAAIADGTFNPEVYADAGRSLTGRPSMKAIGDGSKPPELEGRISLHPSRLQRFLRRPERPLPVDYGTRPVTYTPPVPPEEIARREAERDRQLRALEATYGPEVAHGA